MFYTALDRNETWDTQMNWADAGEKVKQKYIDKGAILDDLADYPFMALYEDNTWAHCEEIFQYDVRNQKHLERCCRCWSNGPSWRWSNAWSRFLRWMPVSAS